MATTTDQQLDAVPSAARQGGVTQPHHDGTGGTGTQADAHATVAVTGQHFGQSKDSAVTEEVDQQRPRVTRGGCSLHPAARTITTAKGAKCT